MYGFEPDVWREVKRRWEVSRRRSAALGLVHRFGHDESGVAAVVLGILFTVVLFMAALAIDDTRYTSEWMQDRYALDAALLAASHTMGQPDQDEAARARAEAFYVANRSDGSARDLAKITIDDNNGTIAGTTRFDWSATLLKALGYDKVQLGSGASVERGKSAEVVMVLDNSSSMQGTPLYELQEAAQKLTETLFVGKGNSDRSVKVGVVPFASSVNVGPNNKNQDWIDSRGLSPLHRENYQNYSGSGASSLTRFDLFERLGTSWGGGVEARTGDYELNDTLADAENPATLFVPMFAPDEPDDANNPDAQNGNADGFFYNSYIDDNPTPSCPVQEVVCTQTSKRGNCTKSSVTPLPPAQAQRQICKYDGVQSPTTTTFTFKQGGPTMRKGPNFGCEAVPLLPLTNSREAVEAKLYDMVAMGGANISEGVMWGHRVLSPGSPFMEGASFEDKQTRKFMVLLARGANFIEAFRDSIPNHSIYSTWGFGASDRLNPQSHTDSALTNAMNSKSREACRLVSDAGVKLYTIGFGVSDAHTRSMLQYCASHPSMNFDVTKGDELLQVFERIGREISELRVSG